MQKKIHSRVKLLNGDFDEQGCIQNKNVINLNALSMLKDTHKCCSSHRQQYRVVIKKCTKNLHVGLDIKFTTKIHPLDGQKGIGTVHKIHEGLPAKKSSLEIGDRVLTLFGKIIHTKDQLYAAIAEKRAKIANSVVKKKFYTIPVTIERPCRIAKMSALHLAQRWLDKHSHDTDLCKSTAFEYRCEECDDSVKFFIVTKHLNIKPANSVSTSGKGSRSKSLEEASSLPMRKKKKSIPDLSFSDLFDRERVEENKRVYDRTGVLLDL